MATESPGPTSLPRKRPSATVELEQVGAAVAAPARGGIRGHLVAPPCCLESPPTEPAWRPNALAGERANGLREWIQQGCPSRVSFEAGRSAPAHPHLWRISQRLSYRR